jgi:hypothetical protein
VDELNVPSLIAIGAQWPLSWRIVKHTAAAVPGRRPSIWAPIGPHGVITRARHLHWAISAAQLLLSIGMVAKPIRLIRGKTRTGIAVLVVRPRRMISRRMRGARSVAEKVTRNSYAEPSKNPGLRPWMRPP